MLKPHQSINIIYQSIIKTLIFSENSEILPKNSTFSFLIVLKKHTGEKSNQDRRDVPIVLSLVFYSVRIGFEFVNEV